MSCSCLDNVTETLATRGQYLVTDMGHLWGSVNRPVLQIYRVDTDQPEKRRTRAATIQPTFCPFCGLRYERSPT